LTLTLPFCLAIRSSTFKFKHRRSTSRRIEFTSTYPDEFHFFPHRSHHLVQRGIAVIRYHYLFFLSRRIPNYNGRFLIFERFSSFFE